MAPILAAIGGLGTFLAANAGTIGTALTVAGGLASAGGSIYGGIQQENFANAQAKAIKQKGDQEFAIAQRKAIQDRREKTAAIGRTMAIAAASGGGTGDTVSDIMASTERQGEYNALTDLFNGTQARNDLYNEAALTKLQGKQAKIAGFINAGSTLLSTGGSIYSDYSAAQRAKKTYDYQVST